MATITNPYDALYTNLKNAFTVEYKGASVSVADFVLAKAGKSSVQSTALTVQARENHSIVNVLSLVNDKLTLKVAPKRDETLTKFPIRTSASAIMSAVAACAIVFGCTVFSLSGKLANTTPYTADAEDYSDVSAELNTSEDVIYE